MNFKTYTSSIIDPAKKNILLEDIYPEKDERGIIEGIVTKGMDDDRAYPAVDALVSLYKLYLSGGYRPEYHTYTDDKGRFLFPVKDMKCSYVIKAFYFSRTELQGYMPYESKPFSVQGGEIYKLSCQLEREARRVLEGKVLDRFQRSRIDIPVELHLTLGPNKIPIVELGQTRTDRQGNFNFSISPGGNYCIQIII